MTKDQIVRGLPNPTNRIPCAIAIGNFDGVHLGHQALLKSVVSMAKQSGLMSAVITFEPHPREFFGDTLVERISTLRDRYEAILSCGIDRIYLIEFNETIAGLTPEAFVQTILIDGIDARWITVGVNFTFGAKASGNSSVLQQLGQKHHITVVPSHLISENASPVSSSRIREAMHQGNMKLVQTLLGRPYTVTGRVIHGAQIGRTLGFPTLNINILPPGALIKPALRGVYAVKIHRLDETGNTYFGVASLGVKPTIITSGARWLLETNVFDWDGDAYGKIVSIEFVEKLRDEKRFSGIEELKANIHRDAQRAREIFGLIETP